MKLYTKPGACSLADHIALHWIGQPFDVEIMDAVSLKTPEHLARNPSGSVPVLEVDGWHLTQNAAILNYLADTYPQSGLGGDGSAKSRAEINRWLAFVNADVHPSFWPVFGSASYLEDPVLIEKSKEVARKKLRGLFERANKQLEDKDWITGSRSIADPYLFVVLRWARGSKVDLSGFDHLERYFQQLSVDAGVQAALVAEGLN